MVNRRRNIRKSVDAILCGDVHLREDTPVCRTDVFLEAQWEKLRYIKDLQKKHQCPVLCSGDLLDTWDQSNFLLSKVIDYLPEQFHTVYGNHELPFHNMKFVDKCGTYLLWKAGALSTLPYGHFGEKPPKTSATGLYIKGKAIHVWHTMTYKFDEPFPGCTAPKARSLLNQYPQFDLIVTGDNHQPFTQYYDGRLLVNVGSMMRQTADQMHYKPCVWLWNAETNTAIPEYLPIKEGVVTREHLEVAEQRDERIDAFITSINTKGLDFVNFKKNMEHFLGSNRIRRRVKEIINEMTDEN